MEKQEGTRRARRGPRPNHPINTATIQCWAGLAPDEVAGQGGQAVMSVIKAKVTSWVLSCQAHGFHYSIQAREALESKRTTRLHDDEPGGWTPKKSPSRTLTRRRYSPEQGQPQAACQSQRQLMIDGRTPPPANIKCHIRSHASSPRNLHFQYALR